MKCAVCLYLAAKANGGVDSGLVTDSVLGDLPEAVTIVRGSALCCEHGAAKVARASVLQESGHAG